MPTLDDLLGQTMLFTGLRGAGRSPLELGLGSPFHSPEPRPRPFSEIPDDNDERQEAAYRNAIWRLAWDPGSPGTFTDVTCRTRGMGMDYAMPAAVLDKVEFRGCQIERLDGSVHDLYLSADFMIGAWWQLGGLVPGGDRLWPLRAKLDVSAMIAFAYQLTEDGITPLSMPEIEELGDELMPAEGWLRGLKFTAGDPGEHFVCVGPSRYIVAVELVLCKERPDFVPGEIISFARVHPHGFIWANEKLERAELSIVLQRPAHGMQCGASQGMKEDIGLLLVSDANDEHNFSSGRDKPLPFTDNLYDYYCTDPAQRFARRERWAGDHLLQRTGEVTLADARHKEGRVNEKAVTRHTKLMSPSDRDIRKVPRQGQFDNVHMAARMRANNDRVLHPTLDDIVMINMCVHDCLHMHVRWSDFLDDDKMLLGWGPAGPYTKHGAPTVPPNQSVFLSFPKSNGVAIRYRAVAQDCQAGEMQVFCHHGAAYAIDEWPSVDGAGAKAALMAGIGLFAGSHPYEDEFIDEWTEFYWRVRYVVENDRVVERLQIPDLEKCMR